MDFIKIKIPEEKKEIRKFYELVEMARVDKAEYLIVMTPKMFEQLKTEKFLFDKMRGDKNG